MREKFVDIQGDALLKLRQCFESGPLFEDGKRDTAKHLVGTLKGLKIEVFSKEHTPPHFRVKCGGETNSFRIEDGTPIYPDGDLKKYFRNIKKWHGQNKDILIKKWNATRPSGCQVGEIKPSSPTRPSEIKSPKI